MSLSPPSCCHLFSLIRYLGGLTRGQGRPSQPVIRRFAASLIRPPNLASHIHLRGLDENVSKYTAERAEPSIVPSGPQPSADIWGPEARGGGPLIRNRHRDGRQAQWYTLHMDHQVIVLCEKESTGELKTGQKTHTTNQQQQQAKNKQKNPKLRGWGCDSEAECLPGILSSKPIPTTTKTESYLYLKSSMNVLTAEISEGQMA